MRVPRMNRFFSLSRNRAALRRLSQGLRRNRRGVALVEFAFVLPVMLAIYFGAVELGEGVMIERKVTSLARAVGDLTAQQRNAVLTDAEMGNIFDAAKTIMAPFTGVAPGMVVSSIVINNARIAKVCWSSQRIDPALEKKIIALPESLKVPKTSLIMATASYEFEPTLGYVLTGKIKIEGGPFYMRPRTGKIGGTEAVEQIEREKEPMC
jgi:Flp pilus assembly protein TadG